jgi:beta-lactam-binding protein with PASTA domain
MADIFLSYASADRERAKRFAALLESRGWSVWWDRTIPPGSTFDQVIEQALDSARCVVVLWSSTSVKSDWVKTEAADAARRRILVPVLIDTVKLPLEFRRIQAADLSRWAGDADHPELATLFGSIGELLSQTPGRDPELAVPAGPPRDVPADDAPVVPSGGAQRRPPGAGHKRTALLAALAVVVLIVAGGSAALWWRPRVVSPDVVGLPADRAGAVLKAFGLSIGRQETKEEEGRPAGTVTAQTPAAGERVRKGTSVVLVVAATPRVTVPDVRGRRLEQARALLQASGLASGSTTGKVTGDARPDVVLGQKPEPGARVDKGTGVELVIAARETVVVPSVVGEPVTRARDLLRQAGLATGKREPKPTDTAKPGLVLSQVPAAGESAGKGQDVDLVVSAAPAVPVPDLVGVNLRDAQARLDRAGLKPGNVDRVQTGDRPPDTVIRQNPSAGEQVEKGKSVQLTIAAAPVVSVPDVTGLAVADARSRLERAGLIPGPVNTVPTAERAPDTVLRQSPAAGEQVAKNQAVSLTVAAAPLPGIRTPDPSQRSTSSSSGSSSSRAQRGDPSASPMTTIRVPDVSNRPVREAMAALQRAGLVGTLRDVESGRAAPGMVVFQHPRAGTEIETGKRVDLAVALAASSPDSSGNDIKGFVWRDVSPTELKIKVTYTYAGNKGSGVTIHAYALDGSDRVSPDFVRPEVPVTVGTHTVELIVSRKAGAPPVTSDKLRVCMANREQRVGVLCRTYAFGKSWH